MALTEEDIKSISKDEFDIITDRVLSKKSLYGFFLLCMKNIYKHIDFIDNWHYKYTCDILQERTMKMLRHEKGQNLIINMPIRALKTILISEIYPVWLWVLDDRLMIQNTCCTQRLASKSSRMSKLIVTSEWFQKRFPEIKLSQDNKSKSDYSTQHNGIRQSYGIDSSIIGASFDVLCGDDFNDPSEINSEIALKNVIDTYKDVISGRANNEWSIKILVMQRTSNKDITQYLLDNNANDYRHINITAELTDKTSKEVREYYKDGLFFPKRYSRKILDQYKRDLSPHAYMSQLMGAPSSVEGNVILRSFFSIKKYSEFNKFGQYKTFLFLDTAFTSDENNDPTGFFICTCINKIIYVIDCINKHYEFNDLINEIKEIIVKYNIKEIYIEKKASGLSVKSELHRLIKNVMIMGVDPGKMSKMERVQLCKTYLNNHNVQLLEGSWNEMFLDQCANFPYGKHDDLVDTMAYSIITLLINRYGAKSILEAGSNETNHEVQDKQILYREKNAYLNDKSDINYYD
jgi:predicted phage terminase large subunit-like protein